MVWAGNISSWAKSLSSWVESSQTFIKNTFSWVEPDLDWASWVDPGKNLWIYKSIKNHQVQMIRAFATKKKYFYQISILGRWNLATIKACSIVGSSSLSWRVEFELIWASSLLSQARARALFRLCLSQVKPILDIVLNPKTYLLN